jgi:hypothetical protein
MEVIFSLLTLVGMGYAGFVGVRWMLKAGQTVRAREMPLSSTDLKVLEESAARLMNDLRAAADECVSRVELALADAEHRIAALESTRRLTACPTSQVEPPPTAFAPNPSGMIAPNEPAVEAARQSGLTTGEVELLRGLRQISTR